MAICKSHETNQTDFHSHFVDQQPAAQQPTIPVGDNLVTKDISALSSTLVNDVKNTGGGWGVVDWSPDDSKLLLQERISVNESRLHLIDHNNGNKTRLLPEKDERTTFDGISFTRDGKGIYLVANSWLL